MRWALVLVLVPLAAADARAQEADDLLARQLAATVRDPRLSIWVRVEACRTLGKIGPRAAAAVPDLAQQLQRLRGTELAPLQEAVIDTLGLIGSAARPALPAMARTAGRGVDIDQALKRSTDLILASTDEQDLTALLRQLASRDPSFRLRAVKAIGLLGPAARVAIPDVQNLLTDPDGDVRRSAVATLRLLQPDFRPNEPVVRAITADLADPDPLIRANAARALARLGVPAIGAIPVLEGLLNDPDPDVRRAVADALTRIGTPPRP